MGSPAVAMLLVTASAAIALLLSEWLSVPPHSPVVVLQPAAPQPWASAVAASPPPGPAAAPALARQPSDAAPAAPPPGPPVRLVAQAPHTLGVGDMAELVVSVDARRPVSRIAFTVTFDPNVLQARSGAEGEWMLHAGMTGRFEQEISPGEDRIRISVQVDDARPPGAPLALAIVGFQAMAPGMTSATVSDIEIEDGTHGTVPVMALPTSTHIRVVSLPA
ncbi:cohesin domain-containing protein [Aquincola sp. MAHUQ-54]|uniref:Cohesin domain-containing protein n=1 Tax=Aquincola agrisoli TaxID=3119538 RepID=A0AAW9QMC0_9BURK